MRESALALGKTHPLVGVLSQPDVEVRDLPAVVIFNLGLVVPRCGYHRISVKVARRLAALGFTVLRFDHAGIGDSPARKDNLPFDESAVIEAREVMDSLEASHHANRFILAGLCLGTYSAMRAASSDERVVGAILINAQGLDQDAEWNEYVLNRARAREYWKKSLFRWDSWKRALSGGIQYRRLVRILLKRCLGIVWSPPSSEWISDRVVARFDDLERRGVPLLLIYSEGDEGLDYLEMALDGAFQRIVSAPGVRLEVIPDSDHRFTLLSSQRALLEKVEEWTKSRMSDGRRGGVEVAGSVPPLRSAGRDDRT